MESQLSPNVAEGLRLAFERYRDLPFPIYASDKSGRFLYANEQAITFFGINRSAGLSSYFVGDFYAEKKQRENIIAQIEKTPPESWKMDLEVRLRPNGKSFRIRFSSLPFFGPEGLEGLLCIAFSVSDGEWFKDFQNTLEAGFFEMNNHLTIKDCNPAFAKILNYGDPEDLVEKALGELLWTPETSGDIHKEILGKGHIEDIQVKMRRKDGVLVFAKMSCLAYQGTPGHIAQIKGTIRDITPDVIEDNIPVGLFMVTKDEAARPILTHCNHTFAKIHGFDRPEDLVGRSAREFHGNPAVYTTYKTALNKAAAEGKPLLEHYMEIHNRQGKNLEVVVNVQYVKGENQEVRVGSMSDVTGHEIGRVRRLAQNFSALLHTYLATVNGLRDTLMMMTKAHGQDLLKENKYIDRTEAMASVIRRRKRVDELLHGLAKTFADRKLDQGILLRLQKAWANLNRPREEFENKEKDNAAWIRRNLIEVNKLLRTFKNLGLPKELIRDIRNEVEELLRLTSMISASISIDELNERIPEFYYFRDYLRRGEFAVPDKFADQNMVSVLLTQLHNLEEFASSRHVTIVQHFNQKESIVVSHRADLNRAFHNILHNAIKYSWTKGPDRQAHVDIFVEKKKNEVEIIIENWGVPITKEELENDAIIQFGRRGRIADDRGRSGTGIGLYDTFDIITKHQGTLRITSEPTFGNLPEDYKNPFITRAYITLPLVK